MANMKKHVGILNNTGVRCVVVFRKIPDDDENCLIVETERLPDMIHDNIMECVGSPEAQQTNDFYEILNRRTLSDGTNALQALHYKNFLRKTPIEAVSLLPFPGQKLPLGMLNAQIDGTMDQYTAKESVKQKEEVAAEVAANPMSDMNDPTMRAKALMLQADMLEAEAKGKREEALALDPELGVKKAGRPKSTPEEKAVAAEARKAKRRERDRAKAADKKSKKAEAVVQAAIDSKIVRDAERTA